MFGFNIVSKLIYVLTILSLLVAPEAYSKLLEPQSRMNDARWAARYTDKLQEAAIAHPRLILLGDSIIESLELQSADPRRNSVLIWRKFFVPLDAIDLGFAGDTTANLLWRIESSELSGFAPEAAVVLIGTNDVNVTASRDAASIAQNIYFVVNALHQRLPDTRIIVVGLLPTQYRVPYLAVNDNLALRNWELLNARFVDIGAMMLSPNGRPDAALYLDPLLRPPGLCIHPNAIGWKRLTAALDPFLLAVMKPQ